MKLHQLAKQPLILQTIFKFIEYDDLLNLKILCSDLVGPITPYVQSKTVVISQGSENYGQSAFSNDYLVGKSLARFRMNDDMHLAIKHLVLYNPLVLFNMTTFDNLTHLTIESTTVFNRPTRMTISLQNLEEFEASFESNNFNIVLEAPKLSKIWCSFDLSHLKIIHPHPIQELSCIRIENVIKQMVNLTTLRILKFKIFEAGSLLSNLKQLRKFYFFVSETRLDTRIEGHLRSVMLANPNLRIFFKRIDFNANPLQNYLVNTSDNRLDDHSIQVYQMYIDAIEKTLNHDLLEISSFDRLSVELIRKMTLLSSLHVLGAITDAEKWVELLKLPRLAKLKINSPVEEHHLDLILEHCPTLASLEIDPLEVRDWVLRLKFLEEFTTGALFDFELFKKMIQQLYYLKAIRAFKLYEIKIEDGWVECYTDGEVVLREPKAVFLHTIESANLWSALFDFQ